jgi:hypothetical protein
MCILGSGGNDVGGERRKSRRRKSEYDCIILSTNTCKCQRIQRKFAALCCHHFFPHIHCIYADALGHVK